jgi:hypothetical protein
MTFFMIQRGHVLEPVVDFLFLVFYVHVRDVHGLVHFLGTEALIS